MEPYLEFSFWLDPVEPWNDLLIDELGSIGFEAFEDNGHGFNAYIGKSSFHTGPFNSLVKDYAENCSISYEKKEIAAVNWNEKWESEFEAVNVDGHCLVKAPFHQLEDRNFEYVITLNPKMAFGTGHHQTTYLMLRAMLELDFNDKDVLDMGCGTSVLAILAAKKNAGSVRAIDIDDWAYENSIENCTLNNAQQIIVEKGDVTLLEGHSFNIILANINKNVLLADINMYAACLEQGGHLLLSGFFEEDLPDIDAVAGQNGLQLVHTDSLKKWSMARYVKNEKIKVG